MLSAPVLATWRVFFWWWSPHVGHYRDRQLPVHQGTAPSALTVSGWPVTSATEEENRGSRFGGKSKESMDAAPTW